MELPHVGTHCSVRGCNMLDFLPFTCEYCSLVTCLDHKRQEAHCCAVEPKQATTVPCPLCSRLLPVNTERTADAVVDSHMRGGCKALSSIRSESCGLKRCQNKSLLGGLVRCKTCRVGHCLRHRLPEDHKCSLPKAAAATKTAVPRREQKPTSRKPDRATCRQSASRSATGASNLSGLSRLLKQ